ncbi:MAG TPA: TatD family hydrolase, partial [Anaerolineales bacterium]
MLTDTHCHLDFEQFDDDRDAVLQRALASEVQRILIPAVSLRSSVSAVLLAQSHPALFAAIGVHPNDSSLWDAATIPALSELTSAEGLPEDADLTDDRRAKV